MAKHTYKVVGCIALVVTAAAAKMYGIAEPSKTPDKHASAALLKLSGQYIVPASEESGQGTLLRHEDDLTKGLYNAYVSDSASSRKFFSKYFDDLLGDLPILKADTDLNRFKLLYILKDKPEGLRLSQHSEAELRAFYILLADNKGSDVTSRPTLQGLAQLAYDKAKADIFKHTQLNNVLRNADVATPNSLPVPDAWVNQYKAQSQDFFYEWMGNPKPTQQQVVCHFMNVAQKGKGQEDYKLVFNDVVREYLIQQGYLFSKSGKQIKEDDAGRDARRVAVCPA